MLDPRIVVLPSPSGGRGLFTLAAIRRGDVVWRREPDERSYTYAEVARWDERDRARFWNHAYQVGADRFSGPAPGERDDPASFMNHACDPVAGFVGDDTMVALRDVAIGEEITYHYLMSEAAPGYALDCRCGSPRCVGRVRPSVLLDDPVVRDRVRGFAMSHVEMRLRQIPLA